MYSCSFLFSLKDNRPMDDNICCVETPNDMKELPRLTAVFPIPDYWIHSTLDVTRNVRPLLNVEGRVKAVAHGPIKCSYR